VIRLAFEACSSNGDTEGEGPGALLWLGLGMESSSVHRYIHHPW
jgi:hypothetical protein